MRINLRNLILKSLERVDKRYVYVVLYHMELRLGKNPLKILDENPTRFFKVYRDIFGEVSLNILMKLISDVLKSEYGVKVNEFEVYDLLVNKKLESIKIGNSEILYTKKLSTS